MKSKKKKVEELSNFAALVYVFNQLLLMGVIIIGGFILFEYRTGVKDAKYDADLNKTETELPVLKDNKDHIVYTLLINELPKEKKLSLISIIKYDKHQNSTKLVNLSPDMEVSKSYEISLEQLFYQDGLPKMTKKIIAETGVEIEHVMVATPYAAKEITGVIMPKKFQGKELNDLVDDVFSVEQDRSGQALTALTNNVIAEGFSKQHLIKLPKALGLLMGYTDSDFTVKEISSLAKNLIFEKQQPVIVEQMNEEQTLLENQPEILKFFE